MTRRLFIIATVAVVMIPTVLRAQSTTAARIVLRPAEAAPPPGTTPVLAPRQVPPKEPLRVPAGENLRVIVKFRDDLLARALPDARLSLVADAIPAGLLSIATQFGADFTPLVPGIEARLAAVGTRAARNTGRRTPDFGGLLVATPTTLAVVPPRAAIITFAGALLALDEVEFVQLESLDAPPPPPADIPPVTPDLSGLQTYSLTNPGIDLTLAWAMDGRGAGVRLSDCEYGYQATHEDLADSGIIYSSSAPVSPSVATFGYDIHGTATLGIVAAGGNGFGMTGLLPDVALHFYTEWPNTGLNRTAAVADAIADSEAGDVVMLEMQEVGPPGGTSYVPAEYALSVWNLVQTATDAGIIVVAAAGNGNQDLDSGTYASYMARGDSGAIIVGAGSATTAHNKLSFSTHGTRVNLQAWGESVATTGYGSFATYGGDPNQTYTATFNGTSAATPLVTAAVVAVQSIAERELGAPLAPLAMRDLLINTGRAQGTGAHIGPSPDVDAALHALLGEFGIWRYLTHVAQPGADTSDNADIDGDGLTTLLEFALGDDPLSSAAAPGRTPYAATVNLSGIDHLEFTFRRRTGGAPDGSGHYVLDEPLGDIAYEVQESTDLETWNNAWPLLAAVYGGSAEGVTPIDAAFDEVRVAIPLNSATRRFVRLSVTRGP